MDGFLINCEKGGSEDVSKSLENKHSYRSDMIEKGKLHRELREAIKRMEVKKKKNNQTKN